MVKSSLITSRYNDPECIRQWQLTYEGDARCLVDAPVVSDLLFNLQNNEDLSESEANNVIARIDGAADLIRYGVSVAEQYERDERVREPGEDVPKKVNVFDDEGNVVGTDPHPQWKAYDEAQARLAAATADTVKFVLLRKGEPTKYEEDGVTETPDWLEWKAAKDRFSDAVSSIIEDAPPLMSPDRLPPPANPPVFS